MQHSKSWITLGAALAAGLGMLGSARADTTVATFDNFTPNVLYASWATSSNYSTASSYVISNAFTYGSLWKQIGLLNAAGNSNLVFDVNIDAAYPTAAASNLTVIVDLKDGQSPVNTQFSYRFHHLGAGHHILAGNLFSTNTPATDNGTPISFYEIRTNSINTTTYTLDLSQLWHLNVELDPTSYTSAGDTYTITLNDLTLTSGTGATGSNVCAVIDAFDGTGLAGLSGGWTTQISTPTNLQITASGFGDGWAPVSPVANTDSNKILQVGLTLTAPSAANGLLGPIVVLQDGAGRQIKYAWYGQSAGTNLVLASLLGAGTLVAPATNFDFTTISFFHVQLDPSSYSGSYTVAWNDISVTGCTGSGGGGGSQNVCAALDAFDGTSLAAISGGWTSQVSTPTNLQVTGSGFGDGYAPVAPLVSTDSGKTLQLNVTLTAPSAANGKLGPIVVLQDGAGNQLRYAWYGQNPGTNMVLTNVLSAGVQAVGTTFDFTTISYFHVQLDPSTYSGAYTVAWNDLSIVGCTNSGGGGTAVCATIDAFSNDYLSGLYGSWTIDNEVSTDTNLQMTASGWGGGWHPIGPTINTTSNMTLQLDVTLTAGSAANGLLGPIVVLEDGDGTQFQYAWYGHSPGTNLVLTMPLNSGTTVAAGTTPGFDFSTISFFHLQLDPSSYAGSYTVAFNNLAIIGCAPPPPLVIAQPTYDPSTGLFTLTWSSENGALYAVQAAANITDTFTDILDYIPSGGATTSVTISLTDPSKSFVRVRKQ